MHHSSRETARSQAHKKRQAQQDVKEPSIGAGFPLSAHEFAILGSYAALYALRFSAMKPWRHLPRATTAIARDTS